MIQFQIDYQAAVLAFRASDRILQSLSAIICIIYSYISYDLYDSFLCSFRIVLSDLNRAFHHLEISDS